ncbi:hypothetical protein BpHYR1_023849 [Brachionus plicatilis]|uniref:Uncharacterized protein n=1 Tax=Brachionus plicatilis TaxID=10195 RepID=A0A3M7S4Q3_BRAPC|nr:hypothetical protein BpHYR1_023849 [Brachionus plicatilis]
MCSFNIMSIRAYTLENLNKIGNWRKQRKQSTSLHLIGISKIQNIPGCEIPLSVKNIPIGEKRKPGRPAKAKQALIVIYFGENDYVKYALQKDN